ncbi:MAG: patatin-like phospholipase family protein [Desulfobacteraceae bacterium]|nr:patatin-like phospholipase family protein [Desulfobacteraceae bacterium]
MTDNLLFLGGEKTVKHVKEKGLSQDDVKAVIGASGAAKWLVLYGLDKAIYSQWFKDRKKPLYVFGTSIGAWKFAAAAQENCAEAFDRLADAYIHQVYKGKITPQKISLESERIIKRFLPQRNIQQILSHPYLRLSFSAVRCKGLMASENPFLLSLGVLLSFIMNFKNRHLQRPFFERTLFQDSRNRTDILNMNDFVLSRVPLNQANIKQALLASGSIPLVMDGIKDIPSAPKGIYRDGGVLDYHPVFPFIEEESKMMLYPHFYPYLIPGWFDKKWSKRRAAGKVLDNTLILAPSPGFISKLPYNRIPDRKDFQRMKGNDKERIRFWKKVAGLSHCLGEEFLEAVETGKIKTKIRQI